MSQSTRERARQWVVRRYTLLLALSIPCATLGQSGAATRPPPSPPVMERTLAALPSIESLADDGPWKRFIDPGILSFRLERTRDIAQEHITELLRDFSDYSFQDVEDWYGAVSEPSVPLSSAEMSGRWQCREMHVNANGALSFPFDVCHIRQTETCLEFGRIASTGPISGCLHRVDDKNFVFAQTGGFDRDNERSDGFLSAASESHLRLIVTHRYSMDVFELVRN